MQIIFTGCKHTPTWDTLQAAVRQATGDEHGQFTRITRIDRGVDYRSPGEYELVFLPSKRGEDEIRIALTVTPV